MLRLCLSSSLWLQKIALFIALLAATVSAGGLSIQNPFEVDLFPKRFSAGRGSLVSWKPTAEGTVSLKLFAGSSTEMQYISTIAHFIDNTGRFTWTPSIALEEGDDYSIFIVSDANDQHFDCSPTFAIDRPVLRRQEDQSSYLSDFPPESTLPPPAAATTTTPDVIPTNPPAAATSTIDDTPTSSDAGAQPTLPVNGQTTVTSSPTNPASPTQPSQSSSSATGAAAGAAAPSGTSGGSSGSSGSSSSSSSGLPTGAAVGIGVGATLVVLALVSLLIFFLLRRRRRQRQKQLEANQNAPTGFSDGPSELETGKSGMAQKSNPMSGGPQSPAMWAASDPKSELEAGAGAGAGAVGMGAGNKGMAELSAPPPLSQEEHAELERRKRAAELQGRSIGGGGAAIAELSAAQGYGQGQEYGYEQGQFAGQGGQVHPRAELEALRANARVAHELSGQSPWGGGGPGSVR